VKVLLLGEGWGSIQDMNERDLTIEPEGRGPKSAVFGLDSFLQCGYSDGN
jgi:hypothetical protein